MNQLKVSNISKQFNSKVVVEDMSFCLEEGQVVGLLGPNGAGKTTSFYMVVGLLKPDSGKIELNDKDISQLKIYQRSREGLSYLPQEPSIFRKLTVKENLQVALEAKNFKFSKKKERLESLVNDFGIGHILNSYGYELSGGERRRVEIARSLTGFPKFLLLDEPFAGIDPIAVGEIQKIILQLKELGLGILITDHNVRETLGICDKAYILKSGRVEVEGTREEVLKSKKARDFYLGEDFKM